MTDPKVSHPITTISGKYYAGMKKPEAERHDCYSKKIGIDFKDIDKNKDGILSPAEICDARDQEVKRINTARAAFGTGATMAGAGLTVCATGIGAGFGALLSAAGGLTTMAGTAQAEADGNSKFVISDKTKLDTEIEKTELYRSENGLNLKM
ncbi:MAG: hypothetical protein NC390_00880 [Fusobacterium sp.]|nr:hypothetical protein [Fusobacterium sp.]